MKRCSHKNPSTVRKINKNLYPFTIKIERDILTKLNKKINLISKHFEIGIIMLIGILSIIIMFSTLRRINHSYIVHYYTFNSCTVSSICIFSGADHGE